MRMKLRRKKQGVLRVWENSKKICLRKVFQLVLQTPVCYALCAAPNPKMLVLYMDEFRIKFAVTVARKNCLKVENPAPFVDDAWKKSQRILSLESIIILVTYFAIIFTTTTILDFIVMIINDCLNFVVPISIMYLTNIILSFSIFNCKNARIFENITVLFERTKSFRVWVCGLRVHRKAPQTLKMILSIF